MLKISVRFDVIAIEIVLKYILYDIPVSLGTSVGKLDDHRIESVGSYLIQLQVVFAVLKLSQFIRKVKISHLFNQQIVFIAEFQELQALDKLFFILELILDVGDVFFNL